MNGTSRPPIAILAFSRPDYLRAVLASLAQQRDVDLADRPIALFQDGGFNERSGVQRADQATIDANISIFKAFFPSAQVAASPTNLGVALNFDRAERWAFEDLGAPAAIFLEDDLVLSPYYLAVLERLLSMALRDPRIGYVAAYGDWTLPLSKQKEGPGKIVQLGHHWGFGLTQRQWLQNRAFVDKYLKIVENVDYQERPHEEIRDFFINHGLSRGASSQDNAKACATLLNQCVRINTTACLARYIGESGVHMVRDEFQRLGFNNTEIYPGCDFEIEPLSDSRYLELLDFQRSAVLASPPVLAAGGSISFAVGEIGPHALRQGFYEPEPWGTWAYGMVAQLALQIPQDAKEFVGELWIEAHYHLPPTISEIDVGVDINGQAAGRISLGSSLRKVAVRIPEAARGDRSIAISFRSPSAASPHEFGVGEDRRPLTLWVASITWHPSVDRESSESGGLQPGLGRSPPRCLVPGSDKPSP